MGGDLVQGPIDTTTWASGAGLVEDGQQLAEAMGSGNWLQGSVSGLSAAGNLVVAAFDPIGTLLSWGVGWLIEHLEPLKGWMNDLTGDPGEVRGTGATWAAIGGRLRESAETISAHVLDATAGMSGMTIDAYVRAQSVLTDQIRAVGDMCAGFAQAVSVAAELVQVVHDLTRDALSQVVGSFGSAIIQAAASAGVLIPKVIADVAATISTWAAKLGRYVDDLLASFTALQKMLKKVREIVDSVRRWASGKFPRATAGARSLDSFLRDARRFSPEALGARGGRWMYNEVQSTRHLLANEGWSETAQRLRNSWSLGREGFSSPHTRAFMSAPGGDDTLRTIMESPAGRRKLGEFGMGDMSFEDIRALQTHRGQTLPVHQQNGLLWLRAQEGMEGSTGLRAKAFMDSTSFDPAWGMEDGVGHSSGFNAPAEHLFHSGSGMGAGTPQEIHRNLRLDYPVVRDGEVSVNPPPASGTSANVLVFRPEDAPGVPATQGVPLDSASRFESQVPGGFTHRPGTTTPGVENPYGGLGFVTNDGPLITENTSIGRTAYTEGTTYVVNPDGSFRRDQVLVEGRWIKVAR